MASEDPVRSVIMAIMASAEVAADGAVIVAAIAKVETVLTNPADHQILLRRENQRTKPSLTNPLMTTTQKALPAAHDMDGIMAVIATEDIAAAHGVVAEEDHRILEAPMALHLTCRT